MFTQIVLLALSAMPSTFATPYAQTSAPPASLQTTILGIQTNINSLINDIVRSNTAAIQSDYSSAQSQLATLFTSLGFEQCGHGTPQPPSTADGAVVALQQTQLGLSQTAQGIINSDPELQSSLCSAIGWFSAVSCFAGIDNPLIVIISGCPDKSITTIPPTSTCTSTICADYINSCGQTYGGCYEACSGYTTPSFTDPGCPTTTSASITTYACNPAHSYGNGATCIVANGTLTLVSPSSTTIASASFTYGCNPAHQYPTGVTCVLVSGTYQFSTVAAASASAT